MCCLYCNAIHTARLTSIVNFLSFQVEVIEGYLICPETERKFPIFNGIPNMLLNEDEI